MKRLFIVLILVFSLFCGIAVAEDIEIALTGANTDPDLAMYVFYASETSGNHTIDFINSPDLLGTTQCIANDTSCISYWYRNIPWNKTIYYVVTAVDLAGGESGTSNEAYHTSGAEPDPPPNDPAPCYIRTIIP